MTTPFDTYTMKETIELKNRLVMAPMTTWSSQPDGQVSQQELDYYGHRSTGVGMVITGATYVTPNGMGFEKQFYSGDDLYVTSMGKLAQSIHLGGAKAILQVFHAGRMSHSALIGGNRVESASAVAAERENAEEPRELNEEEIYNILDAFYAVTKRAVRAGFDGIEIHGANGYLVQQFFSPHSNRREDYWGGDVESRMRFPIAVISSVKRALMEVKAKDFIIGYRLSPEETETPGIRIGDTLKFVDILADQGISYLNLSLQHYGQRSLVNKRDKVPVGMQIINKVCGRVPVMGAGSVTDMTSAQEALDMGYDLIQLGRSIIMNPDWVDKAKNGEPIRQSLKLSEAESLYIPEGLLKQIKARDDWFPVED